MGRKFFVCGNWKMNCDFDQVKDICRWMNQATFSKDVEVVVAPSAMHIQYVSDHIKSDRASVAVQNVCAHSYGDFTGENSANQALNFGCEYAIVGHNERRYQFHESDLDVGGKVGLCLRERLGVIACIGESEQDRKEGKTMETLYRQMKKICANIWWFNWNRVVIAYEPVWAQGRERLASPEEVQEVHHNLREWIRKNVMPEVADQVRIIYAGRVQAWNTYSNCKKMSDCEDIDGFMVSTASFTPEFIDIVNVRENDRPQEKERQKKKGNTFKYSVNSSSHMTKEATSKRRKEREERGEKIEEEEKQAEVDEETCTEERNEDKAEGKRSKKDGSFKKQANKDVIQTKESQKEKKKKQKEEGGEEAVAEEQAAEEPAAEEPVAE